MGVNISFSDLNSLTNITEMGFIVVVYNSMKWAGSIKLFIFKEDI